MTKAIDGYERPTGNFRSAPPNDRWDLAGPPVCNKPDCRCEDCKCDENNIVLADGSIGSCDCSCCEVKVAKSEW